MSDLSQPTAARNSGNIIHLAAYRAERDLNRNIEEAKAEWARLAENAKAGAPPEPAWPGKPTVDLDIAILGSVLRRLPLVVRAMLMDALAAAADTPKPTIEQRLLLAIFTYVGPQQR